MDKVLNVIVGEPLKESEVGDTPVYTVENDPILSKLANESQPTKKEEKEARKFLKDVQNYIKSDKFVDDCKERAKCTGKTPLEVGQTYIGKVAGIIGDGLCMAVDTANIGAVGLIDLISILLTKTVNLICNIVRGIIRTVTFGRTNHIASAEA